MEIYIKSLTGVYVKEWENNLAYTNDMTEAYVFAESDVDNENIVNAVMKAKTEGTYNEFEIDIYNNPDMLGFITLKQQALEISVTPGAGALVSMLLNELKNQIVSKILTAQLSNYLNPSNSKGKSNHSNGGQVDEAKLLENISNDLKIASISKPKETLNDYICEDFLKDELLEIVSFFNEHTTYIQKKIKLPKGVLFKGLPGTGKTYAARCIAGTTDAIFINTTASALQGMYIGSGAENIRKVFDAARYIHSKLKKGVIIFIDELDSLGSRDKRSPSSSGEEDRTLNQLLAEMSGFEDTENIMVIAATNFPEKLDSALLRSGRIGRQINIDLPNFNQRKAMVDYYFKNFELEDTDTDEIAEITEGCTPADISSIANESAILSVRQKTSKIKLEQINETVNRVLTSNILNPDPTKIQPIVAAHEAGHVLAEALYNNKLCIKVTCLPYGETGGFAQHSTYDIYMPSSTDIIHRIKILLAGRAAEQVLANKITVGASNDLERAFNLIRNYFEVYHFEDYDYKNFENICLEYYKTWYNEVVNDFQNNLQTLKDLANELYLKKTLYRVDICKIIGNIVFKGGITC